MDNITIRSIATEDAGELLTLQRAAYATEAQIYDDPFLPALTQSLEHLIEELSVGEGIVAMIGGRIVAAVRWTIQDDTVHIGRLTVAPDKQGQGLGTRLLRHAEQTSGAATAELFTGHKSEANIKLYLREGYAESHRELLREGVELVYFTKHLR
ncbi:MAG: GNAT family N-acetyltransferase [Rhodoglobus sp.]